MMGIKPIKTTSLYRPANTKMYNNSPDAKRYFLEKIDLIVIIVMYNNLKINIINNVILALKTYLKSMILSKYIVADNAACMSSKKPSDKILRATLF